MYTQRFHCFTPVVYFQQNNILGCGKANQNSPRHSIMVILDRDACDASKCTVFAVGEDFVLDSKDSLHDRKDSLLSRRSTTDSLLSRKSVTFCDLGNKTFTIPCRLQSDDDVRRDENLNIKIDDLLDSDRPHADGDQGDQSDICFFDVLMRSGLFLKNYFGVVSGVASIWKRNHFDVYFTSIMIFFAAVLVRLWFDPLSASASALIDFHFSETHLFYLFDLLLAYGFGVTVGHQKTSKFTYRVKF